MDTAHTTFLLLTCVALCRVSVSGLSNNRLKRGIPTGGDKSEYYENIGYLGNGYNIFFGNPMKKDVEMDPGFTQEIFDMTYENEEVSDDQQKMIPDDVQIWDTLICSLNHVSDAIATAGDYQREIQRSVSLESKIGYNDYGASFTANDDFKEVKASTTNKKDSYIVAEGKCSLYTAQLKTTRHKVSDEFRNAVIRLMDVSGKKLEDKLSSFVTKFGTHYLRKATLGGKYGQITKISNEELTKNADHAQSFKVGAQASMQLALSISGNSDVSHSTNAKLSEEFSKNSKSQTDYSFGSRPPADGDIRTWLDNPLNPMPIHYYLDDIYKAVRPPNILVDEADRADPEKKEKVLELKKTLKRFLKSQQYCKTLIRKGVISSCEPLAAPTEVIPKTCRLCKTCGGAYEQHGGSFLRLINQFSPMRQYYHVSYDEGCKGNLMNRKFKATRHIAKYQAVYIEAQVCCAQQECKVCQRCGGDYPADGGAFPASPIIAGRLISGMEGWGPNCNGMYDMEGSRHLCCRSYVTPEGSCTLDENPSFEATSGPLKIGTETKSLHCPVSSS